MQNKLDAALSVHTQALSLRSKRASVLASNLANADTPNFKARDLEFGKVLENARQGRMAMAQTRNGHIGAGGLSQGAEFKYRVPQQASLDGNTVDADVEHSAFAENTVKYQASLQFLDSRIKGIIKALRGE